MSKKYRVAFFNLPAHGHVNPTLPVVAELVRRGHTVSYYNTKEFRAPIARTGAEFRPYPEPNLKAADFSTLVSSLANVTVFLLAESQRLLPFALNEFDRDPPDLVIFDSIALWGMQAAYLRQLPTVASISTAVLEGVSDMLGWRDYAQLIGQALPKMPKLFARRRALVKRYGPGVFPHKAIFPCIGVTNIVYTSRHFQPQTSFVDASFHFVGPSINTASRAQTDFPWDRLTAARPRIYISLGTIHSANHAFYHTVFTALAGYPGQIVLAVGRQTDPTQIDPIPDNFIVCPSVPQLELLQKVDLFITHGGMNSVNEGLYYGVPLVVAPQHMEQALNGRQAAKLGAGVVIGNSPPFGRVNAKELRTAVDTVLADNGYRQNAEQVGHSFRGAGGYQQAADVIEGVLR